MVGFDVACHSHDEKLTACAVHSRDDGLRASLESSKCLLQSKQILALM